MSMTFSAFGRILSVSSACAVELGIKVEVLEVDGAEARAFAREHTVEEHLEEFERCGVCANIPWETDVTATNGDAGTIGIVFFRMTNYHGVADFLLFVVGNIIIVNEKKGVSARDSFGVGGGSRSNSLAQSSELVGVGGVPSCLVAGVSAELAMFEEFTS